METEICRHGDAPDPRPVDYAIAAFWLLPRRTLDIVGLLDERFFYAPEDVDYCLSICSADFNEWVDKNASTRNPRSYSGRGEYEIFEFDLGGTFNYAEMAALIAPRPFMVERGHFDGVADDWTVAYEYSKVRFLYAAKLGIADRTEIEWFVGPHKINAQQTFAFLHTHLDWPVR